MADGTQARGPRMRKTIATRLPLRDVRLSLALIAAVYLLTLGLIDRRGFWIVDNAAKFIQMESIVRSGYRDFSIPIAARSIDPDLRLNPVSLPFSRIVDGRVFPVFSPVFAVASSIPYRVLGMDGLYLLPLFFSLLTLGAVARIAELLVRAGYPRASGILDNPPRASPDPAAAVLLAGLCTPLWFYSAVFWEHAIATAFCLWAVWFHLSYLGGKGSRYLALGAALGAAAVWFRDDLYLFCAVLIAGQVIAVRGRSNGTRVRILAIALGVSLAVLVPLWVFQWKAIGRPFGFHLETHLLKTSGLLAHLGQRPRVLYNLLVASHESLIVSLVVAVPLLAASAFRPRVRDRRFRILVPLLALCGVIQTAVALSGYRGPKGPLVALDNSNSLLPGAAILAIGFLTLRSREGGILEEPTGHGVRRLDAARWLGWVSVTYAALYVLIAPELGSRGIHWGNRFLLPLYPLMAIAAAMNIVLWFRGAGKLSAAGDVGGPTRVEVSVSDRGSAVAGRVTGEPGKTALTVVLVLAVAASLGSQIVSIGLLGKMTSFSDRLNTAVEARPEEVIMTDTFWTPQFLHRLFFTRKILLVRSGEQYQYFLGRMQSGGRSEFLYLTGRPDLPNATPDLAVGDGGLRLFSIRGYAQNLVPPR
jgi:hypothetical protein